MGSLVGNQETGLAKDGSQSRGARGLDAIRFLKALCWLQLQMSLPYPPHMCGHSTTRSCSLKKRVLTMNEPSWKWVRFVPNTSNGRGFRQFAT